MDKINPFLTGGFINITSPCWDYLVKHHNTYCELYIYIYARPWLGTTCELHNYNNFLVGNVYFICLSI